MMIRRHRAWQGLLASTAALVLPTSAWAQSATPVTPETMTQDATPAAAQDATAPAPQDAAPTGLADIIVTAQRQAENVQRAGLAVEVVSAAELTRSGVVTVATLNTAVPSLAVTQAGGANTSFYVRGVGNFTVNAAADPAIAFNYDNVYFGRPTSTTLTFYDLERIEVLKGPQGILYGRNATAGAINIVPVKPRYGEVSGFASVGYARFDSFDAEAAINLPIGGNAAFRLSAKVVDSGGYNADGTNDQQGVGVRAQFMVDVTDALTVRVSGDYSHQGGVGPGPSIDGVIRFTPGTAATATSIANYTFVPAGFDPFSGFHSPEQVAYQSRLTIPGAFINPATYLYPFLDNDYYGVHAEVTLATGIGDFVFIPAYRDSKLNIRFNGPGFYQGRVTEHDRQFSSELRLQGKSLGPVDWLIGGYYFDEDIDAKYNFAQYQVTPFQDYTTGTQSLAGFGRLVFNVTEDFRLIGGARYTRDKKYFDTVTQTVVQICTRPPPPAGPGCFGGPTLPAAQTFAELRSLVTLPAAPGAPNSVPFGTFGNRIFYTELAFDRVVTTNRLTYRLAAEYDLGERSLLYASYETGYRGGGFNNTIGREAFEPEFIKAATLGVKNRFLDNRVQLNVEAFYWRYTNQQVSHFGFDSNNNSSLFTENIGASDIKGVEVEGQALITPTTLLRGSVQYLDNILDSFTFEVPRVPGPAAPGVTPSLPQVIGCPSTETTNAAGRPIYRVSCDGQPGFNAPRWSVNAGVQQTIPIGSLQLVLTGDMFYRSNRVIGFEQLAQQQSGETTTFDLTATLGTVEAGWSLSGFVRNVTDEAVPVLAQYNGSIGGLVSTNYAPPRTYGVRASYRF